MIKIAQLLSVTALLSVLAFSSPVLAAHGPNHRVRPIVTRNLGQNRRGALREFLRNGGVLPASQTSVARPTSNAPSAVPATGCTAFQSHFIANHLSGFCK